MDEVKSGKISKSNKNVSIGIFWISLLTLTGAMGLVLPKLLNKMIKSDVDKDVQRRKRESVSNAV